MRSGSINIAVPGWVITLWVLATLALGTSLLATTAGLLQLRADSLRAYDQIANDMRINYELCTASHSGG